MPVAAACTICSKNYLPYARVLMRSVRAHHPDWRRVVLLLDETDGCFAPDQEDFEVIPYQQLGIPDIHRFLFKYSILEANTAVKPWLLKLLLDRGIDRAVYLDPDILLQDRLVEMEESMERGANIVLTPHLTAPINDDCNPSEINMLRCGVWNLGFLAVQNSEETNRFLDWFCARLTDHCVVDLEQGLFVDQKWMDLVPGLFQNVVLLRHEGYNVAYWNLPHRSLHERGTKILVNEVPLRFYHFSGFDPENPQQFSKHQNRYRFNDLSPAMQRLATRYRQQLLDSGYKSSQTWPYAFGKFQDGTEIPNCVRAHYRQNSVLQTLLGKNPFEKSSLLLRQDWKGKLLKPANTFVMRSLWEGQAPLRHAFPDPDGADRPRYGAWFADNAVAYKIPAALVEAGELDQAAPMAIRMLNLRDHLKFASILSAGKSLERRIRRARRRWMGRLRPLLNQPAIASKATGCNVFGYLRCETGVAEASRGGIRALQEAGVPLSLVDVSDSAPLEALDNSMATAIANVAPYNTNVLFVNADQTSHVQSSLPDIDWKESYNIGFWHWELEEFPDHWRPAFDLVDGIWVASRFVQDAISAKANCPVVNIGLPVNALPIDPRRERFGIPPGRFMFLASCDLHSYLARKNPLGAIQAFRAAFGDRTDVELVLKISNPQADPSALEMLEASAGDRGNIRMLTGLLRRRDVVDLLATADCFVSLHRSEGFGLSLAESMALRKPVIGTAYSGNVDFMRPGNSCLVNYSLIELSQDHGPYRKGQVWADPDLDHAAWWMKRLVENETERTQIGLSGQRTICDEYSDAAIGKRCRKRLEAIWSNERFGRRAA